MKTNRFTEEQIVRALKESKLVKKSGRTAALARISPATWYIWKQKYGGLEVNEAKRLKELEQENNKLKRMVANLMLENEAVKEVLKKL
jgi:putative transposase